MYCQRLMLLGRCKLYFKTPIAVFGTQNVEGNLIKRAVRPGKVRLGFIPEEFFTFFYPITGATGPYLFGIMTMNYLVSKEIYVMEHEYYIGLSVFIILYYSTKTFGPAIGKALDDEVEKVEKQFNSIRIGEEEHYKNIIKNAEMAQWRAEGQSLLMEAKKERVAMQLEENYRERLKLVGNTVKNILDYHVKVRRITNKIHQKWITEWIVANVLKSITPETDNKIIDTCIQDIANLADHSKNKPVGF